MNEVLEVECEECLRRFQSSRARTQHRRYVHGGEALFGQTLVEAPDNLPAAAEEGLTQPDMPVEDDSAEETDDEGGPTLFEVAVVAGAVLLAAYLVRAEPGRPPAQPPFEPGSNPFAAWAGR